MRPACLVSVRENDMRLAGCFSRPDGVCHEVKLFWPLWALRSIHYHPVAGLGRIVSPQPELPE